MAIEIERKYLVRSEEWRQLAHSTKRLQQGYICVTSTGNPAEVRIRRTPQCAFVTIKGPGSLVRSEFEYEIPLADAELMLREFCQNNVLDKFRHVVEYENVLWEIDEYSGEHHGLVVAEVELRDASQQLHLPSWVGREVTNDPRFKNSYLAANWDFWRHLE
jgi:CYTH domain-containing protein